MTSAIEHLGNLHQNPYTAAPLFEQFFDSLESKDRDILLSYLLLPLVTSRVLRAKFQRKPSRGSSLIKKFAKKQDRILLAGFHERVSEFKGLTNMSLSVLHELGSIEFTSSYRVSFMAIRMDNSPLSIEMKKAAKNFALLLNEHSVEESFRYLGVKQL